MFYGNMSQVLRVQLKPCFNQQRQKRVLGIKQNSRINRLTGRDLEWNAHGLDEALLRYFAWNRGSHKCPVIAPVYAGFNQTLTKKGVGGGLKMTSLDGGMASIMNSSIAFSSSQPTCQHLVCGNPVAKYTKRHASV
ncbi:hypothetical protein BABINDRAFT_119976 [Babjeviella inositovora NRRL Y-12698]|uniref:Uncharacterized protein n=1 Tax=Babjeviella inositovora NRRL Y-12698 TaxID=984486 RepID=A0A1E3QTT8_9ASCO|nr:uncharacterized protein BABINDRAFT_119976 [Babjeviella inositovora NRRL Y-12698]ODQ81091.1 hypothetical protein BABINDRAFT_119976 [Babjeviella inositovora NRRL Y-12698]